MADLKVDEREQPLDIETEKMKVVRWVDQKA